LIWLLSTPFTLLGGLACAPGFGWYERRRAASGSYLPYALFVVMVAIAGPTLMTAASIAAAALFGV